VPLAEWIFQQYGSKVLNIYYDKVKARPSFPRLSIIFEFKEDRSKFCDQKGDLYFFNEDKQKAIAAKFKELLESQKGNFINKIVARLKNIKYKTKDLLVTFTEYISPAKWAINSAISREEIQQLKEELNDPDIWEISRCFEYVTFFFYTDDQVAQAKSTDYIKHLAAKYFELLKNHDQFGYFQLDTFEIRVDSKENFDNNYESSWFYYYK
jgi:hypothetical protein